MKLWPFAPNWREPYRITYEFRTDIITSRSGREQRRAQRSTPRRSLRFTISRTGNDQRLLNSFIGAHHPEEIYLPNLSRAACLMLPAAVADTSVVLTDPAYWIVAGCPVVLSSRGNYEMHIVQSVNGRIVAFGEPLLTARAVGATLHPALLGRLDPSLDVQLVTAQTGEMSVDFAVTPGASENEPFGPTLDIFNSREVFSPLLNFASGISGAFTHPRDIVDFGRGKIANFVPVPFGQRTRQISLLLPSADACDTLVAFFSRMKGRRGEFYLASGEDDLSPASTSASGSSIFNAVGPYAFDAFHADNTHRAVIIRTGQITLYRKIVDVTFDGTNSSLVFDQSIDIEVNMTTICQWLLVHRLATDTLDIDYETSTVARCQIGVVTLEDLPVTGVDELYTGLDGAGEWVLANFGRSFFLNKIATPIDCIVNVSYPFDTTSLGQRVISHNRLSDAVGRYIELSR